MQIAAAIAAGVIGFAASILFGSAMKAEAAGDWAELPEAVRATFEAKRPGEVPKEIEQESEDGKVVYEAEYRSGASNADITVDASGALVMVKTKVSAKDLPEAVKKALDVKYPGAKVKDAESVSLGYYELDLRVHGDKVEVVVQPDGKIGPNDEDDDEPGETDDDEDGETAD